MQSGAHLRTRSARDADVATPGGTGASKSGDSGHSSKEEAAPHPLKRSRLRK